ncbi:MAG TPA: hypothetical protein VE467_06630 [Chryseolinea sp.]|nr:hypothetical protein [Chryseolinea sp.]
MNAVIVALNIAFLVLIFYRTWSVEKTSLRKIFWLALILKLMSGISLGLLYTYYYSVGDTFLYFQDGTRLASLARTDIASYLKFLSMGDNSSPIWADLVYQQPRAMFLSKVTSLFCLLTADNYWLISLYFSGTTFISAWFLVKKINDLYERVKVGAILGFLFFPSVLFWSAGLIKESVAMAALFFLSLIFLKIWRRERISGITWLVTLIALWVVWSLKYYYLAIFLPVAFTALAMKYILTKFTIKNLPAKVMLWCLIFTIPLLLMSILHPNFYYERFMEVVVSNYYEFQEISDPEDVIHYEGLRATPLSMLQHSPWALFSGLFRPFVTEVHSSLQWCLAIENLILLALAAGAVTQIKKAMVSPHRLLLFSIVMYSILLCVFLALSTPNFGTLSRYRVGFLPYFAFVLMIENPLISKLMSLKIFRNLVR